MRLQSIFLGWLFLVSCGMLNAQTTGAATASPFAANAPVIPGNVKNAPFSADVITEYDRVLENGNHIHRETRGKVFRDSQGRVRTETQSASAAVKFELITIQDPVQRAVIRLDPAERVATIHHFGDTPASAAKDSAASAKTGSFIGFTPQTAQGQAPPASVAIPLGHPVLIKAPLVKTEPLGTKSIEGVTVTGTRTTRTMESPTKESEEPIVSVTESWLSRDLQMVVLSETDDGQSGHSTMKLVGIVRNEPSAQLFQIPPEFTVKDSNPATASVKH